jgi:hypothetical protein
MRRRVGVAACAGARLENAAEIGRAQLVLQVMPPRKSGAHRRHRVKFSLTFATEITRHDFGTATSHDCIIIFLLTSFFNNSMFQVVATKERCEFFHEKWKGE